MPEPSEKEQVVRHARRALWACGLCFALLFVMGLSGIASITLLYDDPLYRTNLQGLEGTVVRAVSALSGVIRFIHGWGGYAGIALAGWAGLEVFAFGRRLKRSDDVEWRGTGRKLVPLGVIGAIVLIVSLVLLIPSGVAAKGFLTTGAPREKSELPDPNKMQPRIPGRMELEQGGDSKFVEWHTRELNYLMAAGALLLVFGASSIRKVQLAAKKQAAPDEEA